MTWLIRLYPPGWRRRYGRELAELLESHPASFGTVVDLIAGAIDAWLNPQSSTAVANADPQGGGTMVSKMLKLRCEGHRPSYTKTDALKAAAIILVGTMAAVAAISWGMERYGRNEYLTGLLSVSWLFPFLYSQRYTELKGYSARVQAVLIGVPALLVLTIVLGAVWLNSN